MHVLFSSRPYDSSESEHDSDDWEGDSSADDDSDNYGRGTMAACSCIEEEQSDDMESLDVDNRFTVYVGIEKADPLCS